MAKMRDKVKNKILIIICILVFFAFQINAESVTSNKKEHTKPWWISDLITFAGIIFGALIILYQLKRQHESSLELQKEDYRNKYRLTIYDEFSKVINKAEKSLTDQFSYTLAIPNEFSLRSELIISGMKIPPINKRTAEVNKLYFSSFELITEILCLIEKYEIVIPKFNIFKLAIGSINYDLVKSWKNLTSFLSKILPLDVVFPNGEHKITNDYNPNDNEIIELNKLSEYFETNLVTFMGYLYDLQVELQNKLLIKLFDNEVLKRKPTDTIVKVITTDEREIENLKKYFEEETDWGKSKRKKTSDKTSFNR